jgi:hypothetical protein
MDQYLHWKFKAWLSGAKFFPFSQDFRTMYLQIEVSLTNKTDVRKDNPRSGIGEDYLADEAALTTQCIKHSSQSIQHD